MKKIVYLLLACVTVGISYAQQDPQFTHYMYNQQVYNPAYSGARQVWNLTGLYRSQWVNVPEQPSTFTFSANGPVRALRGGVGAHIVSDQLGQWHTVGGMLSYAFRLNISEDKALQIGVNGGAYQKSIGKNWNPIDQNDPLIPTTNTSKVIPDVGAGLYYISPTLYAGISTSHLIESKIEFVNGAATNLSRNYFITGGYKIMLNEENDFHITPSTFIVFDGVKAQYAVNANVNYKILTAGLLYRIGSNDAVAALIGARLPNIPLRFGYSYDYTLSGLNPYSRGSHEIMLSYDFTIKSKVKKPVILRNVFGKYFN